MIIHYKNKLKTSRIFTNLARTLYYIQPGLTAKKPLVLHSDQPLFPALEELKFRHFLSTGQEVYHLKSKTSYARRLHDFFGHIVFLNGVKD